MTSGEDEVAPKFEFTCFKVGGQKENVKPGLHLVLAKGQHESV